MRVHRAWRPAVVWRRAILLSGAYGVLCVGVAAAGETAYVVNVGSDDVSVIDTATRSVVATVKVGPQPNGIAVDPDGGHAYVTNFRADTVSVIDTATNTAGNEIAVGHQPVGIAVSPDGAVAYVANRGENSVSVIDLRAGAVSATIGDGIGPGSNGIAIAPDGASAYVNNAFSKDPGTVSVVDTASASVIGTVAVYRNPKRVAIAPDGGTAYVANFRSWNISVVDTAARTFLTGLRVSGRTVGVAVHPNGAYAYVTNLSGSLEVLQTGNNTLTEPIAVGREPYAVALTHRGGEAYVANAGDGTVSVVDLDRDAVVADVAVGDKPFAVAIGCTGAGCTDAPFTPKPTRTVTITPTISVTPTITPTPLSTPTPTPNPNAVVLQVGTASGRPGERVEVSVVLDTRGSSVAGIQIDVGFAPPLAIASASNGILPCTIGPTLRDDLVLSSAFLPSSCTGSACHAIRFLLLSFTDVDPLPDRAVMFSCDVLIAPDAAPGSYPLSASNAGASDPAGNALDTNGVAGAVTVRARTAAARIFASRTSLCSGGPLDGTTCAGDAQCAGWPCVAAQSVCDGGDDDGLLCDCPGGQCDGQSACGGTSPGTCRGGSADGQCCDPDFSCAGGNACRPTQRSCLSDVAKGLPCLHDTQCPGSACRSTGSFCAGGTFDRYACVDERDCPLGACAAPPTPSFDDTGGPTGPAGGGSMAGGGGSCAIGPGPATGPGPVWLFVLPAALLAARSRRRPARPPAAVDARAE